MVFNASQTFGLTSLVYSIALIAICTSLEQNTTLNLTVIATSYFGHASLIASITLIQSVILGML